MKKIIDSSHPATKIKDNIIIVIPVVDQAREASEYYGNHFEH